MEEGAKAALRSALRNLLHRQGLCRGTRGIADARGFHVTIRKGFG